jgi:hypothetical protein
MGENIEGSSLPDSGDETRLIEDMRLGAGHIFNLPLKQALEDRKRQLAEQLQEEGES